MRPVVGKTSDEYAFLESCPVFTMKPYSIRQNKAVSAFTLVEILMVVAIVLISAGVAIPKFVNSYKGAKLRASVRTVIMANRYARSVAVLQQKPAAILFDLARESVEVVSINEGGDKDYFMDQRSDPATLAHSEGDGLSEEEQSVSVGIESKLVKVLADGIRIGRFSLEAAGQEQDDIYWVSYHPSGMCDRYSLRLEDDRGQAAEIKVDPFTGKAKVEYE